MAYEVIPIPGNGTMYEDSPEITILSTPLTRPVVTIKYAAGYREERQPQRYGQIKFTDVLEYRWVDFDHDYSPYENDDQGEGFELIRIIDSQWVETMASKGWFQNHPGQRFGPGIDESRIRHYRISFDDYGCFDVIAFDIAIQEFSELTSSQES